MKHPLEPLAKNRQLVVFADEGNDHVRRNRCLQNAFFGSVRGHPVLKSAIDIALDHVDQKYYGASALDTTGPCVLGKAYSDFCALNTSKCGGYVVGHFGDVTMKGGGVYLNGSSSHFVTHKCSSEFPSDGCGTSQNWKGGNNYGLLWKQRRYYSEPGPTRMKKQSTWFNSSYPCAGRARMHEKINTGVASGAAKQPDLDASRVAILIPVHPPKYDYAKRYLASAKIAQAHTVSDTFFILSPQDEEESFRATFPNITQEFHLILYEQSGIEVVDNLIKPPKTGHKQPADWAVRKKIGGLQKLHEMIMLGNVHPYRFAVVADAELLWARSAVGFAAAVSQRADAPHWHGTCHLNDRVPAVSSTWQVFSQNMSKSDYLSAIAILQAGCTETRNPLNTHFVDMPIYDMSRWQRYANFLDSLRTSCDSTTLKQLEAFEQPLYIYWSLVVERHGNLTTIERTFSTYPWLERMRGHAYPGMIDLLDSSGVLWAPLQVLVSAPTTCTVPKSVYLFFHTDSIENKAVGRGCCGELSPGYTGVAERPYCTEKKPSVPRSAKSGAGLP